MITVPNTYLGVSTNKLPYIAAELEQKNATLTAENVRLQKELEAEHALAEALGHDCERLKDENEKLESRLTRYMADAEIWHAQWVAEYESNAKLRELVRELWDGYMDPPCEDCQLKDKPACADCPICAREAAVIDRMRELGIEVKG